MFARSGLSDLTESLNSGFFADRVILALATAKKRGVLDQEAQSVVNEILVFLRKVIEGFEWTESPTFTTHSAESAEAFSKATRILPEAVNSSELFKHHIEGLINNADSLAHGSGIDGAAVDSLITFFTQYGEAELRRTDNLINPKGVLGIAPWTVKALPL